MFSIAVFVDRLWTEVFVQIGPVLQQGNVDHYRCDDMVHVCVRIELQQQDKVTQSELFVCRQAHKINHKNANYCLLPILLIIIMYTVCAVGTFSFSDVMKSHR